MSNPSHPRSRSSSRCPARRAGMSTSTTDRLSPSLDGAGDVTIHPEATSRSGVLGLRTRTQMPAGSNCELPNRSSGQGQRAATTRVSACSSTPSPRRAATGHDRSVPDGSTSLGSHRLSGSCTSAGSTPDAAMRGRSGGVDHRIAPAEGCSPCIARVRAALKCCPGSSSAKIFMSTHWPSVICSSDNNSPGSRMTAAAVPASTILSSRRWSTGG